MQENTTLASETKQPHPGAAAAPPGPGSRAEGKAQSAPVPLRGNSPTPPKNKIKQPKENPKKRGGEKNHLSPRGWKILRESVRMEGACGSGRLPLLPLRAAGDTRSSIHPSLQGIPTSRSQGALGAAGAGQPRHSAGSSRRGWHSEDNAQIQGAAPPLSCCPAVLPCISPGMGSWRVGKPLLLCSALSELPVFGDPFKSQQKEKQTQIQQTHL